MCVENPYDTYLHADVKSGSFIQIDQDQTIVAFVVYVF